MINPEHVDLLERGPDSIDPPGVASFGVALPVIDRISPELPLGGESIGRNARHDRGTSLPIEPEQVSVRPDIGTVVGDENRQITEHDNAPLIRVSTDLTPLPMKKELRELVKPNLVSELLLRGSECSGLSQCDTGRPVAPGDISMRALQGHEGGIVV